MKKLFTLITATLLLGALLTGCAGEETPWVPALGEYVYEDDGEMLLPAPSLTLLEDGKFRFIYSPMSSYLPQGSYTVEEDHLICTVEGLLTDTPVYIFERSGEDLVFKAEDAAALPDYTNIPDGAVFVWQAQ